MRIVFILSTLAFCFPLYSQTPEVFRIDPSFATGMPAAKVFEEVNYIPLETTRRSLFGTVNQVEITSERFIILDRSTNSILFFDRKGKFKTRIRGKGHDIRSFILEKGKKRIQILQSNTNNLDQLVQEKAETDLTAANALLNRLITVSYYDLEGKSLKVDRAEKLISLSSLSSIELPHEITISNFALAGVNMPDSQAFELNFFKNHQLYKSFLPYNTSKDIAQYGRYLKNPAGFTRSKNDTIVYFTRPLNYSIYEVSPHSVHEKFQLVFPIKYTFPETFFTDNISQNDRLTFFRDNPSMITGISNIHLRKDRLFFKINNNERNWNASNSFMYDLKSGALISINRVSADSSTYFLPLFDYSFGNESFKNIEGDYLYTHISSRRMFQAFEANEKKEIQYPPALEQYFLKGDKNDNPVIVELKPKLVAAK